jgi:hypothetical protein
MNQKGNSLVGMLAVVAIIAILAVVMMKGSGSFGGTATTPRADGRGTTVPGLVKANAEDQVCRSNLSQLRMALQVQMSATADETRPATIEGINLASTYKKCPMGKEPYQYNSTTGELHCVHPGHEKF